MGCGASRTAAEAVSTPAQSHAQKANLTPLNTAAPGHATQATAVGIVKPQGPGAEPVGAGNAPPSKPPSRPPSAQPPSRVPSAQPPNRLSSSKPPSRVPSAAQRDSPTPAATPAPSVRPPSASGGAAAESGGSEDPLAASRLGITLRGLRRLVEGLRGRFGAEALAAMSTSQVMVEYVQKVTLPRRCRLLEMAPQEVDAADVRPPQYFISHAWKNRAARLFDFVLGYLQDAEDSVSVWIDILAVNQHAGTQAQKYDVSPEAFSATVQGCSAGTIVVLDTEACSPASRAWCIFEWTHTLMLHGPDGLHMHLRQEDRSRLFASIDVEAAQCFEPADKAMILREVERHHQSPARFNARLRLQLLLEPLSYRVDVRRLTERAAAAGTVWDFGPVDAWLGGAGGGGGGGGGERVLCISAGAGEGKSTVSAALVGRTCGGGGGAAVAAHHFVKYNDQRRLEPVRLVKSLAYQLAERLPVVCEHLLQLDVGAVAALTDPEEAFSMLLLGPLQAYQQQLQQAAAQNQQQQQPIVLLIDALDEADPPSLQLAAGSDGSGGDGEGEGGGGGGGPVCPTVCGNSVLQLLVAQLRTLPPCVRFIVTTRPDAAAGQVLPCLERAFPGDVTHLAPDALRKGGVAAGDGGGGVLVYHTAMAAMLEAAAVVAGGATAPPPPPSGPPTLADVHDMYGKVFDLMGVEYDTDQATAVSELLQVLLAAREPLSESFLQQMGLGGAIPALPGAPRLFFLDEHHLYTVHRTLDEWLLKQGAAGGGGSGEGEGEGEGGGPASPFAINVARGHERIGLRLARNVWQAAGAGAAGAGTSGDGADGSAAAVPYMLPYTLKYVVAHLAAAAAASGGAAADMPHGAVNGALTGAAAEALDSLLCDFAFLQAALAAGHVPAIIGVLGDLRAHTSCSYDAYRWLQAEQFNLAGKGPREAALHALATVPVGTALHGAAAAAAGLPWRTARVMPEAGGWAQSQMVLKGHPDKVLCIAYSPDGRQLASVGEDDEVIRVWDTRTGRCIAALQAGGHAPGRSVRGVAFSPDGRLLASGGGDGKLLLWDAATGQVTADLQPGHEDGVYGVAFSPDGTQLASCGGDRLVRVWEVGSGACVTTMEGHGDTVRCVAWSNDGRQLASGGEDYTVRVWQSLTGYCMAEVEGYEDDVNAVAFSPDDLTLVSCASDGKVLRYDLAMGETDTVMELGGGEVKSVTFAPRLGLLASSDQSLRLWDAESWAYVGQLEGGSGYMQSVAFSPDGRQIAAGRSDATIRIWGDSRGAGGVAVAASAAADKGGGGGDLGDVVRRVALSLPDGELLATGGKDGALRIWETETGKLLLKLPGHDANVSGVAFSPTAATQVATCSHDGTLRLWDVAPSAGLLRMGVFSPAKQLALMASARMPMERLLKGCFAKLEGHDGPVLCVTYSADGRMLASGGRDGSVRVWDAESGQCTATLTGHSGDVRCVGFSSDGALLASCGADKAVRVWDPSSGGCVATLTGHTQAVSTLAFRPDTKQLVSGGEDKVMRVWDVTSGACVAELRAAVKVSPTMEELNERGDFSFVAVNEAMAAQFRGHVAGLAFSADGAQLATANNDDKVRIWDVETWRCVAELPGHVETLGGVQCVAFSGDGKTLVSGGFDQTVRVWRPAAGGAAV